MSSRLPQVLSSKSVYRGRVVHLVIDRLRFQGKEAERETILHPGAVVIVPLTEEGHIVLVRQYRHAARKYLLELPAGTLEAGENPRTCAFRELIEETGWRARKLKRLSRFYTAPGFTSELMVCFMATGLSPASMKPESDEWLEPVTLPFATALDRIASGSIEDAKTIIGLLLIEREFKRLKASKSKHKKD